MSKLKQLQIVQAGLETTRGTAVAPTVILAGMDSFSITPEIEAEPNKVLGSFSPRGAAVLQASATASGESRATYEDLPRYFDSLFSKATPSGSDPYTYAYAAPETAQPISSAFTLVHGDSDDAYGIVGAVLSKLGISIASGEYIKLSHDWIGSIADVDSIAVLTDTVANFILPQQVVASIGSYGGALTALNCDVISAELEINLDKRNRFGLGTLGACDYNVGEPKGTLKLVAEFSNTTVKAVKESLLGSTPAIAYREIRLLATDSTRTAQFDFIGMMASVGEFFTDDDGVVTAELEFMHNFDSTANASSWCDVEIVNGVAALWS